MTKEAQQSVTESVKRDRGRVKCGKAPLSPLGLSAGLMLCRWPEPSVWGRGERVCVRSVGGGEECGRWCHEQGRWEFVGVQKGPQDEVGASPVCVGPLQTRPFGSTVWFLYSVEV